MQQLKLNYVTVGVVREKRGMNMNHTNTLETNNETMIKKWKRNIPLDYIDTFIGNLNMQSCVWVLYLAFRGMN